MYKEHLDKGVWEDGGMDKPCMFVRGMVSFNLFELIMPSRYPPPSDNSLLCEIKSNAVAGFFPKALVAGRTCEEKGVYSILSSSTFNNFVATVAYKVGDGQACILPLIAIELSAFDPSCVVTC